VNLDRPLNAQTAEDLLWIRRKFLEDPRPTPKLIVHGHTPIEEVDVTRDRINLDTGCVYGGHLTAMVLPDKKLYQVKG
jgi:serine/threonine protein phosphatase 1